MKNCTECGEEIDDDDGESCQECIDATIEGEQCLAIARKQVEEWERKNPQPDYHGYTAAKRDLRYGEPMTPEEYDAEIKRLADKYHI